MEVKNRAGELSEAQRSITLKVDNEDAAHKAADFVGKTLGEFIECNNLQDATLTELMENLQRYNLKWPFRYLQVTVAVEVTRGYTIAVLDDETMEEYRKGNLYFDELDPNFSIDKAYEEGNRG